MSTTGTTMTCPGCGTAVEHVEVHAQTVGDLVNTPLQIGKCIAVGAVLGIVLGSVLRSHPLVAMLVGALLGIVLAHQLARRYNERQRALPLNLWPNSV
ncbi:MAG: hypothetical protein JWL95_2496, partial [Gemmatimonadetes bacterium]|nr:hypothetical protein [Gemmatimonadota bacterium]